MTGATDPGGRKDVGPRADAPRASTAWSIPEIRVVKDDQGRLRIDQTDPATYGAYAAGQFQAIAAAEPKYRDGMTKRPSSSAAVKLTYVDSHGKRQEIGVREIFCRIDGDALVLTHFENAEGEKVKDLPIAVPVPEVTEVPEADTHDADEDDADRLHALAMAELGDAPTPPRPAEVEPEQHTGRPDPPRERRRPSGPLRQYDKPEDSPSAGGTVSASPSPAAEPAPRGPAGLPPAASALKAAAASAQATPAVRALDEGEAAAFRALLEAKAGQARWASGLLMQAAERYPSDRKLQNGHLGNLLKVSLDPSRAESGTPLGTALRGILEDVLAYKGGVLDRDPLKAEKLALQPYARTAFGAPVVEDIKTKVVSGTAQKTPAQVLAKLEDPKLARATRVKLLLEVVPELIESWRPDKASDRSEAGNESSPAIVRKLFSVANEQRQQRKYIDNGQVFRKANDRYTVLEGKLPKASTGDES